MPPKEPVARVAPPTPTPTPTKMSTLTEWILYWKSERRKAGLPDDDWPAFREYARRGGIGDPGPTIPPDFTARRPGTVPAGVGGMPVAPPTATPLTLTAIGTQFNPNLTQQIQEWQVARLQNGEEPFDWEAFRTHQSGMGNPDPGDTPPPEFYAARTTTPPTTQPAPGTPGAGGKYDTVNGPKTIAEMEKELYDLGWPGGEDVYTAYTRTTKGGKTTGGAGTGGTPGTLPTGTDWQQWFEETAPSAYLSYLMKQQGIGLGTPLGQTMRQRGPEAERQYQLRTALTEAGGGTSPTWTEFLPGYMQNRAGAITMPELRDIANRSAAGEPYLYDLLMGGGGEGLSPAEQMQMVAEAKHPGLVSPFLRWLQQTAAPTMQQEWMTNVPAGGTAQKSFLQYILGLLGR